MKRTARSLIPIRASRPPLTRNRAGAPAFTIVELLTAVAVLSIILLLMAQMTGMVNRAYGEGMSRVDNFTKSRAMLDLIVGDLRHAVLRPDLPAFQYGGTYTAGTGYSGYTAGTATNAFYTLLPALSSTNSASRSLSLICYAVGTPFEVNAADKSTNPDKIALWRCDNAASWNSNAIVPFQGNMSTPLQNVVAREMAPGVIRFQFLFRLQDGTVKTAYPAYDPTKPIVSIGVALAVVGDRALAEVVANNQLTTLQGALSGVAITSSAKSAWDQKINAAGFFTGYPKDLITGLRTFERWVDCPSF